MYRSFLSPIDDYSNLPFRLLCQRYGAEAACVPLVNSGAIARDAAKVSLVDAHPDERNIGVQVVGNEPEQIGVSAARIDEAFPFVSWYNINCGCPSVRTMNCGGGSAMLAFPEKMAGSVSEIRKRVDKPVSVKIRVKGGLAETAAICKSLEEAGADFLIIHGRTAAQGYTGKADWDFIKALKEKLSVPLVGNGDLVSGSEAAERVRSGYCDSFMIARAAMGNPMVFSDKKPEGVEGRVALIREYAELHREYLGEPQLADLKAKAVNFISGAPNAAALRNAICRSAGIDGILQATSFSP
ncbi:MAG TPA: tRNA-dihydrouridine synthase family protein [Candidatus Bilamarchaeum sp.]|nr:tRNA-dihydrouridine synthase family protein [Candidatus Bilamarchaeum sp.]